MANQLYLDTASQRPNTPIADDADAWSAREFISKVGTADAPAYRLLLTIPQVCNALAISRDTVYELLRSGRLPSISLGRSRRIRIADLERFVAGLPRTAA